MINIRITGIIALCCSCSLMARMVPSGYHDVARQENVPAEALYSLALTESSYRLPKGNPQAGEIHPWPWTLNVAGRGYYYPTRQEAWQALHGFIQTTPLKRIDVGLVQVNIGWNGHHFNSLWEALDPYLNLQVAARILRRCYEANPGSWITATGCYHHPKGGQPALRYQRMIRHQLASLNKQQHSVPPNRTTSLAWIEPEVKSHASAH